MRTWSLVILLLGLSMMAGCQTARIPPEEEADLLEAEITRRQEVLSGRRMKVSHLLAEIGRLSASIRRMRDDRDISRIEASLESGRRDFYLDYLVILNDTIESYDRRIESLEKQLSKLRVEFVVDSVTGGEVTRKGSTKK